MLTSVACNFLAGFIEQASLTLRSQVTISGIPKVSVSALSCSCHDDSTFFLCITLVWSTRPLSK